MLATTNSWVHFVFGTALFLMSLFLIMLVLVQRGKGGGLAGALGGGGGQSAFGTKAGDTFTKVTIGVALLWMALCVSTIFLVADRREPRVTSKPNTPGQTTEENTDNKGGLDQKTIEKLKAAIEKGKAEGGIGGPPAGETKAPATGEKPAEKPADKPEPKTEATPEPAAKTEPQPEAKEAPQTATEPKAETPEAPKATETAPAPAETPTTPAPEPQPEKQP